MELQLDNIRAYEKTCIGCEKFKKDIMIAYQDDKHDFIDLFLTQEVAEKFRDELTLKLKRNKGEQKRNLVQQILWKLRFICYFSKEH